MQTHTQASHVTRPHKEGRPHRRRGRRRLGLVGCVLVAVAPFVVVANSAAAVNFTGNVYPAVSCTGQGIVLTAVTKSFKPSTYFQYRYTIYKNGAVFFRSSSGTYFTDSRGDHLRMAQLFLDCGPGRYSVTMNSVSTNGVWSTFTGSAAVTCT